MKSVIEEEEIKPKYLQEWVYQLGKSIKHGMTGVKTVINAR